MLLTLNVVTAKPELVWVVSIIKLPLIVDPTSGDCTTNPLSGDTEAVTLPLAIRNTSWDNADCGISNKPAPLPL